MMEKRIFWRVRCVCVCVPWVWRMEGGRMGVFSEGEEEREQHMDFIMIYRAVCVYVCVCVCRWVGGYVGRTGRGYVEMNWE
jgi:hypothetical protein